VQCNRCRPFDDNATYPDDADDDRNCDRGSSVWVNQRRARRRARGCRSTLGRSTRRSGTACEAPATHATMRGDGGSAASEHTSGVLRRARFSWWCGRNAGRRAPPRESRQERVGGPHASVGDRALREGCAPLASTASSPPHAAPAPGITRLSLMEGLLRQRSTSGRPLGALLLATGEQELVEGNTWGDEFGESTAAEARSLGTPAHGVAERTDPRPVTSRSGAVTAQRSRLIAWTSRRTDRVCSQASAAWANQPRETRAATSLLSPLLYQVLGIGGEGGIRTQDRFCLPITCGIQAAGAAVIARNAVAHCPILPDDEAQMRHSPCRFRSEDNREQPPHGLNGTVADADQWHDAGWLVTWRAAGDGTGSRSCAAIEDDVSPGL
jgi:hypothetical protein